MSNARLLALVLALALAVGACGGAGDAGDVEDGDGAAVAEPSTPDTDADDEPDTAGTDDGGRQDATDGDEDAAGATEVTVFFVRSDASGFWVEPEVHTLDRPTEGVARAAMELLFGGDADDPDLESLAPADVRVLATNIRGRVLIVDVSAEIQDASGASAQEVAFAHQLAHTGAAFSTVDAVQLWVDGEPIEELWGHLDWSQPIEPDPYAVSPITITEPAAGGEVDTGEVVLRGEARVFEATLGIRVLGPDGDVVDVDFMTASAGAPERGAWEHTVTITVPGTYTVEAEESDPSDGEGRPPFVVSRSFEVR